MHNLFFAEDGSASAWASSRLYDLGYVGVVRFVVDDRTGSAITHECLRFRDTRQEALEDARSDARELVHMWVHDRVKLRDD